MREDIKEIIDYIQKNIVPQGFKKKDYGIINKEFIEVTISKEGKFKNGINFTKGKGKNVVKCLRVGDFGNNVVLENTDKLEQINVIASGEQLQTYFLQDNDIVFVRSNGSKELVGRSILIKNLKEKVVHSGFCIRYRINSNYKTTSAPYINAWLENGVLKRLLQRENRGTNINNLNQKMLSKLKIYVPKRQEQEKILRIINNYNNCILDIEKLIVYKEKQKKWIEQMLFFDNREYFGEKSKWEKTSISEFIIESTDKATFDSEYDVFSVTKSGICLQEEQFSKKIASEDKTGYKMIHKGDLVFSTMNLWMGSLDVLEKYDIGIVSPAYKVFKFKKSKMIPEFGKYFMKSSYMIWLYNINSEQGASVVRKNLDMNNLLNTEVAIPNIAEQIKISKILKCSDKEIELLEKKLELIKQEKKAMMQLLLTGIVRVSEEKVEVD